MLRQFSGVIFSATALSAGLPSCIFYPQTNATEKNNYLKFIISPAIEQEQAGEYFVLHRLNIYNSKVKWWFSFWLSAAHADLCND